MRPALNTRQLILVDGRSGAGKSVWAKEQSATLGVPLISLDDYYPGWDGLDAGQRHVVENGIEPWSRGEAGLLRRWDWRTMTPGDTLVIDPEDSLIVEGCGALSLLSAHHATVSYWIEAPEAVRRKRALDRDGDMFAAHWVRWALQEDRFYFLHRSPQLASHTLVT
jgi:hypothetical protein